MRLALHQFRKDFRQFRWLLLGLGVLLLLDLAKCQGWPAKTNWVFPFDSRDLQSFGINWMVGAIMGGCGVLVFATVVGDSPHRENAFLRTRPLPASSLWLGKILFLGAFVLLPLVLVETVNMALHGCDWSLVGGATWERLTLVLPVMVIIAAVSGAAENQKTPGIAMAVACVSGLVGSGLIAIVYRMWIPDARVNVDVDDTALRCAMFVLAVFALAFAAWEIRFRPRPWLRWTVFSVLVVTGEWSALYAPTNPEMPGLAQAEINEKTRDLKYRLPLNRVGLSQGESKEGTLSIGWSLSPEFEDLPRDWIIRWQECSAELKTANGETYHASPYPGKKLAFPSYYNLAAEDMRSLSGMLPEGAILESQSGHGSRNSMSYRPFDLPPRGDWWEGRARLTVHGRANVYQWKQVADLDFKLGANVKDGHTQSQIVGLAAPPNLSQVHIVFEQNGVGLTMAADQQLRSAGRWPASRYEFILYDPINRLGRGLDHRSANSGAIGGHTAFQRRTAILRFQEGELQQRGWTDHPEALRLLVFRMDYLGSFDQIVTTAFAPKRHQPWYGNNYSNTERISREDYLRRFEELEAPAADAPRTVVGNYIHAVLQLVEAHRRINDTDPAVRALASLAPRHPEIFLDGYAVADNYSRRALFEALKQGLRPDQKSLVIERLEEQPDLAELLNQRGWHEDAREELFALLDHHSSLPSAVLRSLAWFNDPRADERILQEVRDAAGQDAYQVAERLPRLADRLDQIVAERWNHRSRHYRTHGFGNLDLSLAVQHGKVEALREFIHILSLRDPKRSSRDHSTLGRLINMLKIPGVDRSNRHDYGKLSAALVAVRDRELRYDPVFKQYRLANETSSNN